MKRTTLLLALMSGAAMAGELTIYPMPPDYLQIFANFEKQIPQGGLIAKESVALAIGRAVLQAEYGEKVIGEADVVEAHRDRDFWVIEAHNKDSLSFSNRHSLSVAISARDGRILFIGASK